MLQIIEGIKTRYKYLYAIVLTVAVLLPFAVQFGHSFTHKNHHSVCNSSQNLHIDTHESNCKLLHFQIKQNAIIFNNYSVSNKVVNYSNQTVFYTKSFASNYLNYSLSRAPPVLLYV